MRYGNTFERNPEFLKKKKKTKTFQNQNLFFLLNFLSLFLLEIRSEFHLYTERNICYQTELAAIMTFYEFHNFTLYACTVGGRNKDEENQPLNKSKEPRSRNAFSFSQYNFESLTLPVSMFSWVFLFVRLSLEAMNRRRFKITSRMK